MTNLTATARPAAPKSARLPWATLLILMLLPGIATAQSPTSGSTAAGLAPGSPAGSYALSGFESVSPYNGGLNFRLPLLTLGGRGGAGHAVTLPVEQKWRIVHTVDSAQQEHYVPDANWWSGYEPGYGPGVLQGRQAGDNLQQCGYVPYDSYYARTLTRLTFTAPDGTEYDLRDVTTGGQPFNVPSPGPNCQLAYANRGKVFVTADGTAATFISDADIYDEPAVINGGGDGLIYPSGYLLLRDGTRYRVDGGLVAWTRDRNGNLVSFAYDPFGRVTTITDSLGRQATVSYASGGVSYDQINFKGFGGAAKTVRVWYASMGSVLRTGRPGDSPTPKTYRELFPQLFDASPYTTYNPRVVSAVELPDGRRYEFRYNVYGELARVMLPTGGAFEYDYAAGLTGESSYNFVTGGMAESLSGVTGGTQVYRRVVTRRIYEGGAAAEESRMTFGRPESYNAGTGLYENLGYVTVDQLDPTGLLLTRTRHHYQGSARNSLFKGALDYAGCAEGREYKTESYDADGATLLRKEEQNWQPGAPLAANPGLCANVRVADLTTTLADTNQVSRQTFSYDQYNNRTDVYEYDFGATPGAVGALVRRTHTDYVTTNSLPGGTFDYACDPATTCGNASITPGVIHLRDLPRRQWVSSDAAGANKVSLTEYAYDQTGLTDRAGITGLCTSFTGAQCSAAGAAGYATRGNVTGVTQYADASAGTGAVTSSSAYDVAGNVVSMTDPRGHTSHVSYADAFCNGSGCGGTFTPNTYAFPSGTTSPVPDVSAAHGHPVGTFGSTTALASSTVYDFWTGRVYSATDVNGKITSFEYIDPLDRPTAQVRPDGARTDIQYSDAPGNLYVRTLSDLDASRRTEARQHFDGLGRPYRVLTYENQVPATPWVAADTRHDALGRVVKASLPYRSAGGPTPLTPAQWSGARRTETEYDALGRVKKVATLPDTAAVTTSYTGNAVTVSDQAGKSRRSVADALGRTLEVYEDPNALNYLTSYAYDALGNLLTVTQGAQTRTFGYDSLGRLTSAASPESGTAGYTYDANSNLKTRTDARGVTATYEYDRLNRNIITTYAGGGTSTPAVRRYYDAATNGLGRLHWSEAAGVSAAVFDAYDAVGRPTQYRQLYLVGGAWGQSFPAQRTYNKAGAVTSQTYPSQRVVTYSYDLLGRPADYNGQPAVAGNLGDGAQRTYASEVRYHELGGMEQERFGTQTPVYNKSLYNSRGQLAEMRVSTHSLLSPGQETNWNRGAIINHYSNAAGAWGANGGGPDNNGNLLKQEIYVPNDDQISGYVNFVQHYGYDALNRLTSVEDKPYNGAPDFYQSYNYDRWGNRTVNAAGTWNAPAPQFTVNQATNRLAPPAGYTMNYDAAGNLVYDNYTGAGSRAYDAENRMTSAQDYYGQSSAYSYDADGRRVSRAVAGGAAVWHIYGMDGELLAEYAHNASPAQPQKEYGYRGGELLVQAAAPVTAGAGLTAQYFDNMNFTDLKLVRTDASVNFDWGGGTPHQTVGVDTFSVRWEGKIEPLYSQTYTFYTVTDDGVRLWVNNQLVIDRWVDQGPTEWSGQIALQAGQRYDIRMEFYENGGGAAAKLLWSSASQAKGAVPQSRLYPADASNAQVDLRWMVTDQLGTPRMLVDRTGSLAGVSRRDYLPFGEEVAADLTWRTYGRGYSGGPVRQGFTGYERDAETGLDYAQARYFSSAQGRFTGADPLLASGLAAAPQTWNRYSYALNNPLKYTDPSGMAATSPAVGFQSLQEPKQQPAQSPQRPKPQPAIVSSVIGSAATWEEDAKIQAAHAEATRRVMDNSQCAALFGGVDAALNTVNNIVFQLDRRMTNLPTPQAAVVEDTQIILVNPTGAMMKGEDESHTFNLLEPPGKQPYNLSTLTLSGAEAGAFVEIHEGVHKSKGFGNTDKDNPESKGKFDEKRLANNYMNNWKVRNACFPDRKTVPNPSTTLPRR